MLVDANTPVTSETNRKPELIIPRFNEPPLQVLQRCGGYYRCPKSKKDGTRLGKLVPYAGKYGDEPKKNFVGDIYANYAAMEQQPLANAHVASSLAEMFSTQLWECDVICGVPSGGVFLGSRLAEAARKLFVAAQKKNLVVAEGAKEDYKLYFERHTLRPGQRVGLVEDIVNNATNATKAIEAVEECGCEVMFLVCFLNRSVVFEDEVPLVGRKLLVLSLVRKKIQQYRQDDPFVAADLAAGNIAWHVKPEWPQLMESMRLDEVGEEG